MGGERKLRLAALHALTADLFLDPARIAESYNRLDPEPAFQVEGAADAHHLLREVTHRLAAANVTASGTSPLLAWVETVIPECPAALRAELADWCSQAAPAFGHRPGPAAVQPGAQAGGGYALALIRDTHGAKPFSAEAWYDRGKGFRRLVEERSCTVPELQQFLGEVVRGIASVGMSADEIDLAFLLPASILGADIDRWKPKGANGAELPPIGSTHRVVLRPERLRQPAELDAWRQAWKRWKTARAESLLLTDLHDSRPPKRRAAWLGAAAVTDPNCAGHLACDDLAMVVLKSPPRARMFSSVPDPLEFALRHGIPVALWPRPPLSEDPVQLAVAVAQLLGQAEAGNLPATLREFRNRDKDDQNAPGACFGLVIDDADRPPPTRQSANRLNLPVEFG